jgi:dihydroorotate dehydrogenase (NAD+) catalytic subunit
MGSNVSVDLTVKIGHKSLQNPVGVASGTFGYGREYEGLVDFADIGAIFTKAVTLEPRSGNAPPRLAETPSGLLNSIGLANVGVEKFISGKLPFLKTLPCAVVVNVAGAEEGEYARVIERLEEAECGGSVGGIDDDCISGIKNINNSFNNKFADIDKAGNGVWGYEVNVSCPNVRHGGLAFGTDPAQVERLTSSLRKLTRKPLIIKLTPNVTDIAAIARAAEAGGADAVSLINTLVGMVIDIKTKKPVLGAATGGLSGPAVRPVGVALTYKTSRAVSIPVIGMGGITCASDAIQYLLAGAASIQIGTANFVDPKTASKVLAGIREYCREEGITSLKSF